MKLHERKSTEGSRRSNWRVGRGQGSGNGKTSGKGNKGQNARSGGGVAIGFEGGQTPLYRRLPKRGFTNFTRKEFATVSVSDLNRFDNGATVDVAALLESGLIKKTLSGVKILGEKGVKLEKQLTVKANAFSQGAKNAIENAGGKVEVI